MAEEATQIDNTVGQLVGPPIDLGSEKANAMLWGTVAGASIGAIIGAVMTQRESDVALGAAVGGGTVLLLNLLRG